MFPLGCVLFPSVVLPLHVFEPRYRTLVQTCLDDDREFGVVLIERGSEVGGDDVRTDVGTVARIVEAEQLPDGRWVAGGGRRAPHPGPGAGSPTTRTRWPRSRTGPTTRRSSTSPMRTPSLCALLRRVLGAQGRAGRTGRPGHGRAGRRAGARAATSSAPSLRSVRPTSRSSCAADTVGARLELVGRLLAEEADFLEQRLALG